MAANDLAQFSILCYRLNHLTQTEKVKFYYALKGRGKNPGIIRRYKIRQLSKGVLMVPKDTTNQTLEFLKYWKCPVTKQKIFIDERPPKKSR